ncbi:MAG TPA: hypothetical protein VIF43_01510 [Patescibacteria group bacterium]|jgi:hypothetical protein
MREIEHHLDAIDVGVTGAIEDYERSDSGAFFELFRAERKPPRRPKRPKEDGSDTYELDEEAGLAEVAVLTAGEIDLAEHPSGEIVIDQGPEALLDGIDLHYLAAAIEIARLLTEEFGKD